MSAVIAAFLLALHVLHVAAAATVTTVSFLSYPAYLEQVECVKLCLWQVRTLDDLIAAIGCSPPWVNECFCKAELASSASSFLSGCVASRCTAPSTAPAVTSALAAYNEYCSANGLPIPVVASIQSHSAYVSQSSCVQDCVWSPSHSSVDDLMPGMGCGPPLGQRMPVQCRLGQHGGRFPLDLCGEQMLRRSGRIPSHGRHWPPRLVLLRGWTANTSRPGHGADDRHRVVSVDWRPIDGASFGASAYRNGNSDGAEYR